LTYNWGKDATVGYRLDMEQAQAVHLARRGYVVLAPDLPEAGRRTPRGLPQNKPRTPEDLRRYDPSLFFQRHPDWSLPGKGIWDHQRAVDFLLTLDFVDPERIGCTGISYGGFFALLAAAFDERIKVAVPVVGWSPYSGTEQVRNLTSQFYFPRLTDALDQGKPLPCDFHEIAALIAPRSLYSVNANRDPYIPVDHFEKAHEGMREIWALYDVEGRCGYRIFDAAHGYLPEMAVETYAALDRELMPDRVRRYHLMLEVEEVKEPYTPCAVEVDFAEALKSFGERGTFDPDSVSLYRIEKDGQTTAIGHQLDEGFAYTDKGEVSWLIDQPGQLRYRLEFDVRGRGPWVREVRIPLIGHGDVLRQSDDNPGPLEVAMGALPIAIDWDDDGKIGIVSKSMYSNTLNQPWFGTWFFRNVGSNATPLFADFVRLQVDGEYTEVMVRDAVDYNGNGWIDLIGTLYHQDELRVLLNTGQRDLNRLPLLTEGPRFKLQEPPMTLQMVDLSGDGRLDLVCGGRRLADTGPLGHIAGPFYRSYFVIYPNQAQPGQMPRFGEPLPIILADGRELGVEGNGAFTMCDWDEDGDWDLIVDENLGTHWGLRFFRNEGTRAEPKFIDAGRFGFVFARSCAIRWVDNEAFHGLLVGEGEGEIRYFECIGQGSDLPKFIDRGYLRMRQPRLSIGAYSTAHVCDWDGDGGRDIVSCDEHGAIHLIQEFANYPLSLVEDRRRYEPPRYNRQEILRLDDQPIRHCWGTALGTQGGERTIGNWQAEFVDFYDEGLPGLLVPVGIIIENPDGGYYSNDGDIFFYPNEGTRLRPRLGGPRRVVLEDGSSDFATHSVGLADFTGNGLLDMIAMRNDGQLCLYKRYRSPRGRQIAHGEPLRREDGGVMSWQYLWEMPETSGDDFFCPCDWTGDGRLDLIIGSAYAMFFYENVGSNEEPVFREPVKLNRWGEEIRHSRHNLKPCAVDWDNLGRTDLLVGGESGWFYLFRQPSLRDERPRVRVAW
jgi:dienelactone hydrolase